MSKELAADDLTLPIKRTEGDTIEDRLTSNAYHNILPARYLRKDSDGNVTEQQEELFERVAKNIALAEAVFEARKRDIEVSVTPAQLKPDHPRRDELAEEVFGKGASVDDDIETTLSEYNVNKFAYETVVPDLPREIRDHVEVIESAFREQMEKLSFMPNCVPPDSFVAAEGGLKEIADVEPGERVYDDEDGTARVESKYDNGRKRVLEIETQSGYTVRATPEHYFRVITTDGTYEWRQVKDIGPGQTLAIQKNFLDDDGSRPALEWNDRATDGGQLQSVTPSTGQSRGTFETPAEMTPALAEWLGFYVGDGTARESGVRVAFDATDTDLVDHWTELTEAVFGFEPTTGHRDDAACIIGRASRRDLYDFLSTNDLLKDGSETATVPTPILEAGKSCVERFLRGLFEADGTVGDRQIELYTHSDTLARQAQTLLLGLGIRSSRNEKRDGYRVSIRKNVCGKRFVERVGFASDRKCREANQFRTVADNATSVTIPHQTERLRNWFEQSDLGLDAYRDLSQFLIDSDSEYSQDIGKGIFERYADEYPELWESPTAEFVERDQFYECVENVTDLGTMAVEDMQVPRRNTYVVEGFVSHNSPTLMNAGDELQQLSACFVDSPEDDIDNIHQTAKEAANVFQCLTEETNVHVDGKGVISIADVEPGDEIRQRSDSDHRHQPVEEIHAYGDAPVYRVETEAGIELTGTPNHELLVDGEWTRIDEIAAGDTLSVSLGWLPNTDDTPELAPVEAGGQWAATRTVSNGAILALYEEGLSDYEIAERLDCSASTVQRRRANELGLDPNGQGGRRGGTPSFDTDRFESLYERGHSDSEIADQLDVHATTVCQYRHQQSLEANGEAVKTVSQPSTLTPDLAELLGMWVGDGSKHEDGIRFHLSREENLEHADRLCRRLFDEGLDWRWDEGCYDAVLHSHEIKRWWLTNFGDAKPDATTACVPEQIWTADHDIAGAFLRGLFSTDGCLQKDQYPRLWTASEDLLGDVQQLLLGLGIPALTWELDSEDREYYNVGPSGTRAIRQFADLVGFTDARDDELSESLGNADDSGPSVGTAREDGTWDIPVDAVVEAGTETVYDVTVADEPEYVANSVVSHNSGGGMGYAFWRLRPYGDPVGSTGGIASGPITFMRTYDQMCETIAQGGARRGAQMGVMRVSHPDVIQFIHAKNKDVSLANTLRLNDPDDFTHNSFAEALEEARDLIDDEGRVPEHLRNAVEGHLSNFNISVGITDRFMDAVKNDEEYIFTNPRTEEPHIATEETKELYEMFDLGEHVEVGEVLSVPANKVWERIVEGAHENGEPGVIYLERVNKKHSFDVEEHPDHRILATNPCGEQPLEEYEACNLGHINLSTLAANDAPDWRVWQGEHADEFDSQEAAITAFLEEAIDWEEFDRRIELGTRFLENVVTMSDFPVPEIEEKVREMRKIGLGIMGLAQLYIQLGMKYGSDAANESARQLMTHINHHSKWTSYELAQERGSFEEWDNSKYADPMAYAEWFEHHTGRDAEEWTDGFPIRNHNTTTIAPTGTTSMLGNTTGGCEPIYNVAYYKNVSDDVQGDEMLVEFDDYFLRVLEANNIDVEAVKEEAQAQMATNEFDGIDGLTTVPDAIGELFVTTGSLSAKQHAGVQTACQAGVDSAISKCLEKGTLVQTDSGIRPIESFAAERPEPGEFVEVEEDITIDDVPVESQYYAGEKDATRIRVDNGTELVGATDSHKVLTPDGWKVLGELQESDYIIGRQVESHGDGGADLDFVRESAVAVDGGTAAASGVDPTIYEKDVTLPEEMSPDLARFLGMYAADGSAIDVRYSIEISTSSETVRDEVRDLFEALFEREPTVEEDTRGGDERDTVYGVKLNSKPVWEFVTQLCRSGSYDKQVPREVLQGSREEKLAFINGVTLDGYVSSQSLVVYGGMSRDLADGVAELLRSFGVPKVYVGRKWVDDSEAYAYHVHVTNEAQELVTPIEPHKRVDPFDQRYRVYVPQDQVDKTAYDSRSQEYYAARSFEYRGRNYMFDTTAEKLGITDAPPLYKVTDVEDAGTREMYDIELAGPHEYVVGGVVSHNTVNAPNDSTIEDAKEVFQYIYDHGGKGVTYYRDGTRSKQVLTTRAKNTEFADEAEAAEALVEQIEEVFGGIEAFIESDEVQAVIDQQVEDLLETVDGERTEYAQKQPRPDVLHGVTQRIDTGYGKLYVNINEDPEADRPFELFANIGNSGGFTASFTEALAKTISTALRAGVDPREIADELQGIRSPKVAWDKGEQIQSIPDAIGTAMRRYLDGDVERAYPQQQTLEETAEEAENPTEEEAAQNLADAEPETDGGAAAQTAGSQTASDDQQELIEAGENPECPECGSLSLYYSEGCKTCESCGWSEC